MGICGASVGGLKSGGHIGGPRYMSACLARPRLFILCVENLLSSRLDLGSNARANITRMKLNSLYSMLYYFDQVVDYEEFRMIKSKREESFISDTCAAAL